MLTSAISQGPTESDRSPSTSVTQQGSRPDGLLRICWSLSGTQSVVLNQCFDGSESQSQRSPPTTWPLASAASTPSPPAGKRSHSRQPACFYIQFIHSSIQYTGTFMYRCIYRISYINLSLLFTAILVWIFHTVSTKKVMGEWHVECMSVCGAWLLSTDCIWGLSRPPGGRPVPGWEGLCCKSGGYSRGQVEPSWAEGVAQTPKCGAEGGERHAAGLPFRSEVGRGR